MNEIIKRLISAYMYDVNHYKAVRAEQHAIGCGDIMNDGKIEAYERVVRDLSVLLLESEVEG